MTQNLVVGTLVVFVILGFTIVSIAESRLRHGVVSFGRRVTGLPDAGVVLFIEYSRQQRWAFALLWFSIAAGVLLLIILFGRILVRPVVDMAALSQAVALTIDIGVAAGAYRLYQVASRRVEASAKALPHDRGER